MKNLFFIFGQDTFRSFEYLRALKQKYLDTSLGDVNLAIVSAEKVTGLTEIISQASVTPFLASSRMMIVQNLILQNKKLASQMAEELAKIPSSTLMVFYEAGQPDQRNRLVKFLKKEAVVKQFDQLAPYELKDWVKKNLAKFSKTISGEALETLIQFKRGEPRLLWPEIEKLGLLTSPEISLAQVKNLVRPIWAEPVYRLTNWLLESDSASLLLQKVDRLRWAGESEFYLLAVVNNFCRTMLLVSGEGQGLSSYQLMRKFGLNYYLGQAIANVTLPSFSQIKDFYCQLLGYDLRIKTGKIEAGLALDLALVKWKALFN